MRLNDMEALSLLLIEGPRIIYFKYDWTSKKATQVIYQFRDVEIGQVSTGPEFIIEGSEAPSFLLSGSDSAMFMGICIGEGLRFWRIEANMDQVHSMSYSDALNLLYMASPDRHGFFVLESKRLKICEHQIFTSFSPYSRILYNNQGSHKNDNGLLCMSESGQILYNLVAGNLARKKHYTDNYFRGFSFIRAIKKHSLDSIHSYLLISSNFSTLALCLEDNVLTDVSSVFNIEKEAKTLEAFNLTGTRLFVQIHSNGLNVSDLAQVETPQLSSSKFTFRVEPGAWFLATHHQAYICCYEKRKECLLFYEIKSRPRDAEFVSEIAKVSLIRYGLSEVTCLKFIELEETAVLALVVADALGKVAIVRLPLNSREPTFTSPQVAFDLQEPIEDIAALSKDGKMAVATRTGSVHVLDLTQIDVTSTILNDTEEIPRLVRLITGEVIAYTTGKGFLLTDHSHSPIYDWAIERAAVSISTKLGENGVIGFDGDSLNLLTFPQQINCSVSRHTVAHSSSNCQIADFLHHLKFGYVFGIIQLDRTLFLANYSSEGYNSCSLEVGARDDCVLSWLDGDVGIFVLASYSQGIGYLDLCKFNAGKLERFSLTTFNAKIERLLCSNR